MQDRRRAASETERELARVTGALAEAAAFDAARYSPTLLLADLTAALPAGSAIVAFRADTADGSVVALAPRAAAVVRPLEKVPGLVAPEIVVQDNLTWWQVGVTVPLDQGPWRLGLSAVLEAKDGTKSYWALAHPPGDQPDFHHPDCFAARLP